MGLGLLRGFDQDDHLARKDLPSFQRVMQNFALHLAILGLVKEANEIVEMLPLCEPDAMAQEWHHAWRASGIRPSALTTLRSPSFDEQVAHAQTHLPHIPQWSLDDADESFTRLANSASDRPSAHATTGATAMTVGAALTAGLFIAHHWKDDALFNVLMLRIASRIHANQQLSYLAMCGPAWDRLARGWLRSALDLRLEDLQCFATTVKQTIKRRFTEGPLHPDSVQEGRSIKEILDELNSNTARDPEFQYDWSNYRNGRTSIFHAPASDEALAAAEKKIGMKLPEEVREFFKITNGCEPYRYGYGFTAEGKLPSIESYNVDNYLLTDVWEGMLQFELVPGMSQVQWPTFDDAVNTNADIHGHEALWLVGPDMVERGKAAFNKFYEPLSSFDKAVVDRQVAEYYGSKEAFDKMTYCIAHGYIVYRSLTIWPSFRSFLSELAFESRWKHDLSPVKMPRYSIFMSG